MKQIKLIHGFLSDKKEVLFLAFQHEGKRYNTSNIIVGESNACITSNLGSQNKPIGENVKHLIEFELDCFVITNKKTNTIRLICESMHFQYKLKSAIK